MTSLAEVRDGLAARLETIDGLRVYAFVPGSAEFPAAIIQPPTIPDYGMDLAQLHNEITIDVAVLVPAAMDRHQLDIYPLLENGTGSIFAAVEADRSLGGLDCDASVRSARPAGMQEIGGVNCYGAAITVQVFLGGT